MFPGNNYSLRGKNRRKQYKSSYAWQAFFIESKNSWELRTNLISGIFTAANNGLRGENGWGTTCPMYSSKRTNVWRLEVVLWGPLTRPFRARNLSNPNVEVQRRLLGKPSPCLLATTLLLVSNSNISKKTIDNRIKHLLEVVLLFGNSLDLLF